MCGRRPINSVAIVFLTWYLTRNHVKPLRMTSSWHMPGTVTVLTPYMCYLTCPLAVLGDVCSQSHFPWGYRDLEGEGLSSSGLAGFDLWPESHRAQKHCYRNCLRVLWLLTSETLVVTQGTRILLNSSGKMNSRIISLSSSYIWFLNNHLDFWSTYLHSLQPMVTG